VASTATTLPDVTTHPYEDGQGLPLFIEPTTEELRSDPVHVTDWYLDNQDAVHDLITEAGAVVLRGFAVTETRHFGALIDGYPMPDFGYSGGVTPRGAIEGKVFEATTAPPQFRIPLHQEMSYLPQYPTRLAFWCKLPSATGGETILGDMRRFDAGLRPGFRQQVRDKGVLYQRNFRSPDWVTGHPVLDARHRPWTDAFSTTDRAKVEADCTAMGLEFEWEGDSLTTRYRGHGVVAHPDTGQEVWFNQLVQQATNVENLGPELMEAYDTHYRGGSARGGLPRPFEVFYGDGTEVDPEDLSSAYPLLDEVTVGFPWQAGDVMVVDNFFTAHGRNTFTGDRDIQVALLGRGGA
jgi:alpha-ketoglutarate-dependent taurine dioxygenase